MQCKLYLITLWTFGELGSVLCQKQRIKIRKLNILDIAFTYFFVCFAAEIVKFCQDKGHSTIDLNSLYYGYELLVEIIF